MRHAGKATLEPVFPQDNGRRELKLQKMTDRKHIITLGEPVKTTNKELFRRKRSILFYTK